MDWREEGTTSLSNTSIEKVVVAALRDGRLVSDEGPAPPTGVWGGSIPSAGLAGFVILFFVLS